MCQEDADLVRDWRNGEDRRAIAINTTFRLAPWADVIYGCDHRWWEHYHEQVKKQCSAELWCYAPSAGDDFGLNVVDLKHTGGNSGYQAARWAITHFKAKRLILLGYDMGATGDSHWHGSHPNGWPGPRSFKSWCGWLHKLGQEFDKVEIINASRETALECFPRLDLKSALC